MPLNPPQDYRKTEFTHRIGTAAARPAAANVLVGTLYYSTDTGVLERSNGVTWVVYATGSTAAAAAASTPYLFDSQLDIEPELSLPHGNIIAGGDVWTDVAYDAANFTASTGAWTVDAGDQVTYKYIMLSRTAMCATFAFNTTTTSLATQELRFKLPLNKTARTTDILSAIRAYDNGADTVGFCGVVAGNNYIRNWRSGFSNWAVAVNNTSVQGVVICELNP